MTRKKESGLKLLQKEMLWVVLVFLISFAVYLKTLAPTVTDADSGEFITDVYLLGIPHPTGYPLYVLLGKFFTVVLPIGSIAYRVNVMSAFFASLAVAITYLLVRKILHSNTIAFTASLLLGFSQVLWSQSVIAEVYTLTAFFLTLLIMLLLLWLEEKNPKVLYLLSFGYGLGLTNHATLLLFIPAFVYYLWKEGRNTIKVRQLPVMVLLFLLGLSLYLYLPIRSMGNPPFYAAKITTLNEFIDHVTGHRYQYKAFSIPPEYVLKNIFDSLIRLLPGYSIYLGWIIPVGALIAFKRNRGFFIFLVLIFAADILFPANYNFDDIEAYYIPAYIISAIWMAYGIDYLAGRCRPLLSRFSTNNRFTGYLVSFLVLSTPLITLATNYHINDRSGDYIAYDYGMNILATLDENAVLYTSRDNIMFLTTFLKYVEGKRPDISLVTIQQLSEIYQTTYRPIYSEVQINFPGTILEHTGILYKLNRVGDGGSERKDYWSRYNLRALDEDWSGKSFLTREIIAEYHFHLGWDYYEKGEVQKAREEYRTASLIGEDNWHIYYLVGRKYVEQGWYGDAEREYKNWLRIKPYDADAYMELGVAYAKQGLYDKSLAEFEKAIKADPAYGTAYKNAGVIYYNHIKDYNKTLYYWKKYIELNPTDTQIKEKIKELEG